MKLIIKNDNTENTTLKLSLSETHDGDIRLWVTAVRPDGMPAYGMTAAVLALRKEGYIIRYNLNNSDDMIRRQLQLNHQGKIFVDADIY